MKRALSLIIVLAMVLCMIPFSAFAADAEASWNTGTNFVDGTVTLNADNEFTASYLWQAGETGTMSLAYTLPEGVEIEEGVIWFDVIDNQSTEVLDGAEFGVTEGEWYEIVVNSDNIPVTDLYVYSTFKGQPGTQTNPYVIKNPAVAEEGEEVVTSVEVAGDSTLVYCNLVGFASETVIVEGTGVKVTIGDNSYGSINKDAEGNLILENTAEFDIPAGNPSVEIKLINKSAETATYTFSTKAPVIGTVDDPQVVTAGEYQVELAAGNQGYYYTYTAEGDGTVNVTVSAADAEDNALATVMRVSNLTSYKYNDQTEAGSDSIAVSAGDLLQIMVTTYNPDEMWNAPAGTVTTTIEFVAPSASTELVLGDNELNVANGATNEYTFTPDQDGTLTVAVTNLDPAAGNFGMIFGMGNMSLLVNGENFFSPSVEYAVTAGTPVTVSLANNMGQDETVTLNLAIAEPAGPGESEETAIAIELPWEVTHTGEHDMYYTYTATEDCIVKVTSTATYTLGISGVEAKTYDSLTKYVELATGDTIIINTYSSEDCTYSASIVDALPAGNGSYYFPYVIENLPYTSDINNGDASLYYSYTAAKAATLVFSSENMGAVNVTLNGAWDVLDAENKLVVAAGDVVTINTYEGSFTVDVIAPVATLNGVEYYTVAEALANAVSGDTVTMIADSHEENTNLIIGSGVTLDLVNFNLYAKSVVGFAESVLDACYEDAAGNGADLYVAKNSLVLLGEAAYNRVSSRSTRQILPVWVESTAETEVAHYIFTDVMVVDKGFDNTLDGGDTVELNFQTAFTGHVRTTYLRSTEGIDGNGLSIIAGFSWFDEGINVSQEYFYTDDLVYNYATNNKPLLAGFNGCLKLVDLHVWIDIIADCGLVVSGANH